MGNNVENSIEYWLSVNLRYKDAIYAFRGWSHLKMAHEDQFIWIRGFSKSEIETPKVLSLPNAKRYFLRDAKLIPYGRQLPDRVEPSLLWTPIQRGLPIKLPTQNFNYFGIEQTHRITLEPSHKAEPISATMVDLKSLQNYVTTASGIRLKKLNWTVVHSDKALIIGTPVLPVNSIDYYRKGCFIIPAGWKLKVENLIPLYDETLPETQDNWYLIEINNTITRVNKADFNQLNKGSLMKTIEALDSQVTIN